MKLLKFSAIAVAMAAALAGQSAHADATLDKIHQRGRIVVGVLISGGPFGSIDTATQNLNGYNPALAREIAKELGVELELVKVQTATRVQFLQQGKVDILIANMEYTQERGTQLSYAPTPYYRVGGIAIVAKDSGINRWEDLRGKVACVSQGSNYAKPLGTEYGAQVKGLPSAAESILALRGKTCDASVHDSILVFPLLRGTELKDYKAIEPELIPSPSVIWTRKGETDTTAALDKIVQGWHKSGWLIQAEKQAGIEPPSPALVELHQKFIGAAN